MATNRSERDATNNNNTSSPLLEHKDEIGMYTPMDHEPSHRPYVKLHQGRIHDQPSIEEEQEVEEYWDQFQSIPDSSDGSNNRGAAFVVVSQVFKVILYGLMFLLVFGGLLISRFALMAMAGNIGKYQELLNNLTADINPNSTTTYALVEPSVDSVMLQRDGWVYLIICSVIFPYVWTFIQMLSRVLFSKHPNPSLASFAYTIVMETLHSFGLSLFLWRVLPLLNIVEAAGIFTVVGVVPSVLHILHKERGSMAKIVVLKVLDIVACILQIAGLIGVAVLISGKYGILWEPLVSFLLLSLPYIENYLSTKPCSPANRLKTLAPTVENWKSTQMDSRPKQYLFASALKVALLFGFAFALIDKLQTPHAVLQTLGKTYPEWKTAALYTPLILFIILPLLAYYFAQTAAQLHMQRFCYALPLSIHTPALVLISALFSSLAPELLTLHPQISLPASSPAESWTLVAITLVTCWLSQLWISRHLWFPTNLRLENAQRLFVLPNYCSVHLEQSLAYNRSRDNPSLHQTYIVKQTEEPEEASPMTSTPMIYICATMWHENKNEMLQVLKSILRLDEDQATKRNSSKILNQFRDGEVNPDYYEFEVHIMFDDAMKRSKEKLMLNDFVVSFVKVINEAASALYHTTVTLSPPVKVATPYGGKLIYTLPGENKMVVHLKDKNRIRHRKRWSQIMYMYYLLGFKNLNGVELSDEPKASTIRNRPEAEIFQRMPESSIRKSENTFLLALDGDVDFKPQALQLLVDRVKKNMKVGVVCGRIHPIGSGPMVWYQKFEYAIGHWLQKAAEHVLGCVLCAPGCFSLFRGSAIMDDNIMKTYSIDATEARHFVQYDQGEDRWLSTLLLQRGYKVEYVAASDAFTYAPETFKEFFNQRRRWGPSTMANILDLLASWRHTVRRNNSLSMLYILYQCLIFFSSILGPATIILLIAGAMDQVLGLSAAWALVFALVPPVFFLIVCFTAASDTQIVIAAVLSAFYAVLMMAVMIGSIVSVAMEGLLTPSGVFLILLSGIFILSAVLHPQEFFDLFPGFLYYITIPSGYLLLMIYSMVNMNIVSWGTRETAKSAKVEKPSGFLHSLVEKQTAEDSLCRKIGLFFSQCCGSSKQLLEENSKTMHLVLEKVDRLERQMLLKEGKKKGKGGDAPTETVQERPSKSEDEGAPAVGARVRVDDPYEPAWMDSDGLAYSRVERLDEKERDFWNKLIVKYLKPIEQDAAKEAHLADQLKQMRNNVCFAFFMVNALWIAVIFFLQLRLPDLQEFLTVVYFQMGTRHTLTLEPLTLAFLSIFGITLVLQFLAMLWHRWSTLRHIMAATKLNCSCGRTSDNVKEAEKIARELQRADPTENRIARRGVSLRQRFDRRLTELGKDLQTGEGDEEVYMNVPAGRTIRGHGAKRLTVKARMQRLSTRMPPKHGKYQRSESGVATDPV